MSTFEQRREEIEKMSREETMQLLKELSDENEALLKRSQEMNEQLLQIAEQVKQGADERDSLLAKNKELRARFKRLREELDARGKQTPDLASEATRDAVEQRLMPLSERESSSDKRKAPASRISISYQPPSSRKPPPAQLQPYVVGRESSKLIKRIDSHNEGTSQFSFSNDMGGTHGGFDRLSYSQTIQQSSPAQTVNYYS